MLHYFFLLFYFQWWKEVERPHLRASHFRPEDGRNLEKKSKVVQATLWRQLARKRMHRYNKLGSNANQGRRRREGAGTP